MSGAPVLFADNRLVAVQFPVEFGNLPLHLR